MLQSLMSLISMGIVILVLICCIQIIAFFQKVLNFPIRRREGKELDFTYTEKKKQKRKRIRLHIYGKENRKEKESGFTYTEKKTEKEKN